MKILFKNTTKYDKENCNNFIMFHNNKYGRKELIQGILVALFAIYVLIFNIVYKNWAFIIILLLLCALVYLINKYKSEKNKNKKEKVKEFTFYFYEKYIKIKYKRQFERVRYFEIKKVFETNENFFLYMDEKSSLILDKDKFEIGTSKEFSQFIRRKCPFKYSKEKEK